MLCTAEKLTIKQVKAARRALYFRSARSCSCACISGDAADGRCCKADFCLLQGSGSGVFARSLQRVRELLAALKLPCASHFRSASQVCLERVPERYSVQINSVLAAACSETVTRSASVSHTMLFCTTADSCTLSCRASQAAKQQAWDSSEQSPSKRKCLR